MTYNYADTVTMYIDCPKGLKLINAPDKHWILKKDISDSNFDNYHIKLDKLYVRYYPKIFGQRRLFLTYSLPKLLCNSNVFNVANFDEIVCYNLIIDKLHLCIDISGLQSVSFNDWNTSRIDLFIMHPIDPEERVEYEETYSTLRLGKYIPFKYENTIYLNSILRPDKAAGVVFRAYPKMKEINYRNRLNYPDDVDHDHEECLQLSDKKTEYYRFEFMLRRTAIRYECKKINVPATIHNVLNEDFQKQLINKMVYRIGLNLGILAKREFIQIINATFKTNTTNQNAKYLARQIRNQLPVNKLNKNQIYYIRKKLRNMNIHIVTSKYIKLKPVEMLK